MKKKKIIKGILFCSLSALALSLFLMKDAFLHAEEDTPISISTEDTQDMDGISADNHDKEIMPLGMQTITLTLNEATNTPITDVTVKINNVDYTYSSSDLVNNVLTLTVADHAAQIIELDSPSYYFEPAYIMIDAGNIQANYNIQAFAGHRPEIGGTYTANQDGEHKEQYSNDDTVSVTIATSYPMYRIFYRIAGEWKMSENDQITVNALSTEAHEVEVAYFVQQYYPNEPEPSLGMYLEPENPDILTVSFAAKDGLNDMPEPPDTPEIGTPSDDPDNPDDPGDADKPSDPDAPDEPSDPTDPDTPSTPGNEDEAFVDEEGNTYADADVELVVEEMTDHEKYQSVIADYSEYKDIPKEQITYYQARLMAQDIRVQPNGVYNLILPYPQNASEEKEFVVYQFKDGDIDQAALLEYTLQADGIHVQVDNVSAFVIGWKDADDKSEVNDPQDDNTEDDNNRQEETDTLETNLPNQQVDTTYSSTDTTGGVNTGDITTASLWIVTGICAYFIIAAIIRKKSDSYHC